MTHFGCACCEEFECTEMALVKAKDIPYETEALRKRIEFVKKLQKVLEDESMLVTKTVEAYSEVIDGELVGM